MNFKRRRLNLPVTRSTVLSISHALQLTLKQEPLGVSEINQVSKVGLEFRRQIVDLYIQDKFGFEIQTGPFRSMTYLSHAAGSLLGPKILGTYESELADIFSAMDRYDKFVNIGCAEGYFAVGTLCAAPHLHTLAFDLDPQARALCHELATTNKVRDRIEIRAQCTPADLVKLAEHRTLVMLDIEGAEIDLLGSVPAQALVRSDLVVETHQRDNDCTLGFLHSYFSATHNVSVIEQKSRDPAVFPELMALGQLDRFIAQWEGRGPEPWIFAQARR